jgi:hypothetical protein
MINAIDFGDTPINRNIYDDALSLELIKYMQKMENADLMEKFSVAFAVVIKN